MKILYDHQIFSIQKHGGISAYFYHLNKHISKEEDVNTNISLKYSDNNFIINDPSYDTSKLFNFEFRGKHRIQNHLNKKSSVERIKGNDFDLFHPTYFDPYFLEHLNAKPFVITIFDMAFEKKMTNRDHVKLISDKKKLAQRSDEIIAISESTKRDIINILGIERNKISVVYLAGDHIISGSDIKDPLLSKKYILYVGKRTGYKNFQLFLSATAEVLKTDKELVLVCAGGGGFSKEERSMFNNEGIGDKVIYSDPDKDLLYHLYKNAELFIFPSLYEGFGIPVIEAFGAGCPVLLSDIDVFREIADDAAIYFNPMDAASIHKSIVDSLGNKSLLNELKQRGTERGNFFSWEKTASNTLDIYNKVTRLSR